MKKLLAMVLCVAMIASMCVFSSSAATYWTKVSGTGYYWDSATAYGWLRDGAVDGASKTDFGIEYDVVYLADGSNSDGETLPASFGFSTSAGIVLVARTGAGVASDVYKLSGWTGVNAYSSATAAGPTCQQHVKVEVTSSGMTVWVDGTQVFTQAGISLNYTQWFFQYTGSAAVDNMRTYIPSSGTTIRECDFECGNNDHYPCAAGSGSTISFDDTYDVYGFTPGESVIMASGGNFPMLADEDVNVKDLGFEFDIAFVSDNDNGVTGLGIDVTDNGSNGRLTISRYGVGVVDTYSSADTIIAASTALPTVSAAGWSNQHHVKVTSTSEGIKVYIDGSLLYTNANASFRTWIYNNLVNLGFHAGTSALKNLREFVVSTDKTLLYSDGSTLLGGKIGGDGGYGGKQSIDVVPDYLVVYPTVDVISGYTQIDYSGDLADKQVYTMDLALIPGEAGTSRFTVWGGSNSTMDRVFIELNAATDKASVGIACDNTGKEGHTDHGNFNQAVSFNWGQGTYSNFHKVIITFDGTVTVNIDGSDVYSSGLNVGTNGNSFAIMMPGSGTFAIDNFSLVSGSVNLVNDFESNNNGLGGTLKTIYPCGSTHTFSKYYKTTTEPGCLNTGVGTAICEICGDATTTKTLAALGHVYTNNWNDPSSTVAATATTAGSRTFKCKRCGLEATTSIPADNDYNGTIKLYTDFTSKELAEEVIDFDFGSYSYFKDGKYSADSSITYIQPNDADNLNPTEGYVHSVDVRLNSKYDDSNSNSYGHVFYFWLGGDNQMAVQAGIDYDTNEVFIRPSSAGTFKEMRASVDIAAGEWHNIGVKVLTDWDEFTASIELIFDGEVVLAANDDTIDDAVMVIGNAEGSTSQYAILRMFGLDLSYDNYVQASYDFEWTNGPELAGDVNGDGKVNMLDLLRAKKYVAGLVSDDDVVMANADLDSRRDGIKAADIILIKRIIAAQ